MARAAKNQNAEAAELTRDRLSALLHYDSEGGLFRRRCRAGSNAPEGAVVGSRHLAGYLTVRIDGRSYLLHRLAWLYAHGHWPAQQLDHINGVRSDNRLTNLRECTNAQNCQNVRAHRDGSGLVGTTFDKQKGRWLAQLGVEGKHIFLGYHDTQEAAHTAYLAGKAIHHSFGGDNGR